MTNQIDSYELLKTLLGEKTPVEVSEGFTDNTTDSFVPGVKNQAMDTHAPASKPQSMAEILAQCTKQKKLVKKL